MKNPDDGGSTPEAGALATRGGEERRSGATIFAPGAGSGASRPGGAPKGKRRKRKRGRKVFAPGADRQAAVQQGKQPQGDGRSNERPAGPSPDMAAPDGIAIVAHGQRPAVAPPGEPMHRPAGEYDRRAGVFRDMPVYAALDLGTNNCRLLVAVPTRRNQFRVIDAYSRIVRLGEGLTASGRLGDDAMDRAVEALKVCAAKLGLRSLARARLVATEACRAADNGAAFLARVRDETGLPLEIIDRETEARLAVSGCGSLVDHDTSGVVLFDIGGGSSEIALVDLSRRRSPRLASHIVAWTSLPVGVVSLAERFGGRIVTPESFAAMVDDVSSMLDRFEGRDRLGAMQGGPGFHLLGTSGTVTTIAGVHLGLERYDRRRVDGLWLAEDDVERIVGTLLGWSYEERIANPCIGLDRADLVLAGCAILQAIRRVWPSKRLRVADRGLREGILSDMMAEDGVWDGGARRPRGAWRP